MPAWPPPSLCPGLDCVGPLGRKRGTNRHPMPTQVTTTSYINT